jgi:hypothetical protein
MTPLLVCGGGSGSALAGGAGVSPLMIGCVAAGGDDAWCEPQPATAIDAAKHINPTRLDLTRQRIIESKV